MTLETQILVTGLDFPEGPRWHDNRLWFSDMRTGLVMNVGLDGCVEEVVAVPGSPSGLGWLPDGRLLVVSMGEQRVLRMEAGRLMTHADLSGLASHVLNDMVVDARGFAYVGNFGYAFADPSACPRLAEIVLVTPDGKARVAAKEMAFPNGSVITPDGQTLIVAETLAARLTAFDIALDGSLFNRRVWAQFDDVGFSSRLDDQRICPDGICLDADGAVWVASPSGGNEVLRVVEGGRITCRVRVDTQPFAAMLGGPERRTLFVCTSILGPGPSGIGRIEMVDVEVPGAGFP